MSHHSLNFLEDFDWQNVAERMGCGTVFFVLMLGVLYVGLWVVSPTTAFAIGLLLALVILTLRPQWGLYAIVLTAFFQGWEINFSEYHWAFQFSFLPNVNAPLADIVAVVVILGMVLAWILRLISWPRRLSRVRWTVVWYVVFLLSAYISTRSAISPSESVYYLVRSMLFVMVAFVGIPLVLVDSKNFFDRLMQLLFWVGAGVAVFGFVSLLFGGLTQGWWRAVPISVFGFAPLGNNHNMLGEVLVALIPIAWMVSAKQSRLWQSMTVAGMMVIALLTLSRAVWIALFCQGVFAVYWYRYAVQSFFRRFPGTTVLIAGCLAVGVVYMSGFLFSPIPTESNSARIATTQIAGFYLLQHPVFGVGPGEFISTLASTDEYIEDFGAPLDAHGMIQKVGLETGVVGLIFFSIFLFSLFRLLWQIQLNAHDTHLSRALFLSVLGAVVFQLFNTSYFNANMWLPIGLALTAVVVLKNKRFEVG